MTATAAQSVSETSARPNPIEEAARQVEDWWEEHAFATDGNTELLELLEWQLEVLAEVERRLGEERAVTLRAMSKEAGSIRKLADQLRRPFSTLRAQMRLNVVTAEPKPEPVSEPEPDTTDPWTDAT